MFDNLGVGEMLKKQTVQINFRIYMGKNERMSKHEK